MYPSIIRFPIVAVSLGSISRQSVTWVGSLFMVTSIAAACAESSQIAGPSDTGSVEAALAPTMENQIASNPLLYGVNSNDDGLSIIDPVTGSVTFIGSLDPDPGKYTTPIAMAVRPTNGRMFVWNTSPVSELLTVDPCTGQATPVNATTPPQSGGSLAFSPSGRLFAVDSWLMEIDPTTGISTVIGYLGSGFRAGGADFDNSGVLYAAELALGLERLAIVNVNTGMATVIGTFSVDVGTIGSIVFTSSGTLLGSAFGGPLGNILFDINPANAEVTNIRPLDGNAPQGMAFAPACGSQGVIPVEIDIKPGSWPNSFNCRNDNGVIAVAILTTNDFDALMVDQTTVSFEGAFETHADKRTGEPRRHEEDVDMDGNVDLVFHFRSGATALTCSSTEGALEGETFDGRRIHGADEVRNVFVGG